MIHDPDLYDHSSNCSRREALIVTPRGNWCDGVTSAALALGHRLMPTATFNPSASTGTGTTLQPFKANTFQAKRYPGSSIQTRLPRSRRTRVVISTACCEP